MERVNYISLNRIEVLFNGICLNYNSKKFKKEFNKNSYSINDESPKKGFLKIFLDKYPKREDLFKIVKIGVFRKKHYCGDLMRKYKKFIFSIVFLSFKKYLFPFNFN